MVCGWEGSVNGRAFLVCEKRVSWMFGMHKEKEQNCCYGTERSVRFTALTIQKHRGSGHPPHGEAVQMSGCSNCSKVPERLRIV